MELLELGSWDTFVWQSSAELFAPVQHLFVWMSVFAVVALGLLATLGYFAASRIVTPVRRLQEAARSIGRGELREPIQIKTGDELEELAIEFNRMNTQLEAAFAGLTSQVQEKTQEVQYLQRSTDQVLDAVPTPIIMVDQNEHIQYVNRALKEALGVTDDRLPSTTLFDLLHLDPVRQETLRQELQHACAGTRSVTWLRLNRPATVLRKPEIRWRPSPCLAWRMGGNSCRSVHAYTATNGFDWTAAREKAIESALSCAIRRRKAGYRIRWCRRKNPGAWGC